MHGVPERPLHGVPERPLHGVSVRPLGDEDSTCYVMKRIKHQELALSSTNINLLISFIMIDFKIMSRVQPIGARKGQKVYYAQPKSNQKMSNKTLVEHIVRETSLSAGDVSNALISLSNVVCDALRQGMSVDLAELGSIRLVVTSKMMDSLEDVTVAKALKTPRILFSPKSQMREAALGVEMSIDRSSVTTANSVKPISPIEGEDTGSGNETGGNNNQGGGSSGGSGDTLE